MSASADTNTEELAGTVLMGAGRRSIQVVVYNNVDASLTISNTDKPNDADWIDGEKPVEDTEILPQRSKSWGVYYEDVSNLDVYGTVDLVGYGSPALTIYFYNDKSSKSGVKPAENDLLVITPTKLPGGDAAHAKYRVDINLKPPAPPRASATK